MENNFLTDAELPATVADWNSLNKKISSIQPGLPSGLFKLGNYFKNNQLNDSECVIGTDLLNGKQVYREISNTGDWEKFWFFNGVSTYTCAMQIYSDGTIAKIGGGSFSSISDERMKDNIQPFEDGLNKILSINPKSFQYKAVEGTPTENYPDFICQKTQYGVIAQDLETVAPEMVTTNADGYKSVDLSNLCLLLVNAVKEQNQMIIDLMARVEALENPTPQA